MELLTLDTNYQPLNLVENFESLIWTERYTQAGDFELKSSNINEIVGLMPLESCVTLRNSTVPMVVESYKLENPKNERPTITVSGRSFETVLERRGSVNALAPSTIRSAWLIEAARPSDAAYLAMRIVIGDAARYRNSVLMLPAVSPAVSANDAIPELLTPLPLDYVDVFNAVSYNSASVYGVGEVVKSAGYLWKAKVSGGLPTPSMSGSGAAAWTRMEAIQSYEIKPQNLYGTILELLQMNYRGIKAVRPAIGGNKITVEIYNGANLTGAGDNSDPNVRFVIDAKFDQMDSATYLLSQQASTNVAYSYGSNGAQTVLKTTAVEPSGLARRVLIVDNSGDDTVTSTDIRRTRALIELYKYNATALFDGEVAEQIATGYNKDYFLGDIIKLVGEYGLEQNVRVVEFIRSQDNTGEKAYPTFEAVNE